MGPNGIEKILGLGELSAYEQKALEAMKKELLNSITKGIDFVKK